ncbi:MAG: YrhK family protein [Paracoccaceae bacterium]
MANPVRTLVLDFGWIHTGLGNLGNIAFFVGSIFFLPSLEEYKLAGVWLFIVGALFMMIGSMGNFAIKVFEAREGASNETEALRRASEAG